MLIYAATIFLSAFLLFQVQPLIAKFILPWFGGSAAVWTAALLFFQLLLLAGYFYAHVLTRYVKPKMQLRVHLGLLAASLATLPIVPRDYWKPTGAGDPTLSILLLLAATIGLPYTLLSATSPLLQAWYVRAHRGALPYRLFALSNFGSFLALLSYPFVVEPRLTLSRQAAVWSIAYAVFALACAAAAWKSSAAPVPVENETETEADAPPPGVGTRIFWVALAACASTLLLATTSHLTQNVAPIPLLWVVPLSVYLLSFILCFESGRLYRRWIYMPLLIASLWLFARGNNQFETNQDVINTLIPGLCGALFVCCMVCHGELARRKPHPRYLTQFYLMVSMGGALGGLFVALAAPRLFHSYAEMPIAMAGCAVLAVIALWRDESGVGIAVCAIAPAVALWNMDIPSLGTWQHALASIALGAATGWLARSAMWKNAIALSAAAGLTSYLGRLEIDNQSYYTFAGRNFYGVLRVRDDLPGPTENYPAERSLVYGTINQGFQLMTPGAGRIPTSYFGTNSGINRAIRAKGDKGPIRIGILGLGAGVTASLARPGDTLHYYEINPLVPQIANSQFSFFPDCPADKEIYMGDGRLVLERKPSENLDVLVLDAFSSDAIPLHLLTREAYQIYVRHLKPDGVLIVHISSRYLNLEPVVSTAGRDAGFFGVTVADPGAAQNYYVGSTWMVLSRDRSIFAHPDLQDESIRPMRVPPGFRAWTDDYSNIVRIAKGLPPWLQTVLP
jgi:spermidine synthase